MKPLTIALYIMACAALLCAQPRVLITELFPRATAGTPEWFELHNRSADSINLQNWKFGNFADTEVITTRNYVLAPGDFCVLTRDSTLFRLQYPAITRCLQPGRWHTLDNYNDTLILWDSAAVLADQVFYHSASFTNWTNQSLVRLDSAAAQAPGGVWILADQPTPGQPNPALAWHDAGQPSMTIGPVPFSPNRDGKDDFLAINVQLPAQASLELSIVGFDGKEYFSFNGSPLSQYLWDGACQNGRAAPVGPFFVLARIKTLQGTQIIRKGGVLWR